MKYDWEEMYDILRDVVGVEENALEMGNADRTYQIKIEYRIGISAIVGSKFGTLTLA